MVKIGEYHLHPILSAAEVTKHSSEVVGASASSASAIRTHCTWCTATQGHWLPPGQAYLLLTGPILCRQTVCRGNSHQQVGLDQRGAVHRLWNLCEGQPPACLSPRDLQQGTHKTGEALLDLLSAPVPVLQFVFAAGRFLPWRAWLPH